MGTRHGRLVVCFLGGRAHVRKICSIPARATITFFSPPLLFSLAPLLFLLAPLLCFPRHPYFNCKCARATAQAHRDRQFLFCRLSSVRCRRGISVADELGGGLISLELNRDKWNDMCVFVELSFEFMFNYLLLILSTTST